jgi:hypothetical protein
MDDTPKIIAKAFASLDADDWKEAVCSEMDSILSNGTWELANRPYGYKPVGCKLVFKKKLRSYGTIDKYKARLMAKGYTQKEGEDSLILIHLLLDRPQFMFYSHWLPHMVWSSIRWTLRQISLMDSWKRKSTWHSLMGL